MLGHDRGSLNNAELRDLCPRLRRFERLYLTETLPGLLALRTRKQLEGPEKGLEEIISKKSLGLDRLVSLRKAQPFRSLMTWFGTRNSCDVQTRLNSFLGAKRS
jgi:hypothetical protein